MNKLPLNTVLAAIDKKDYTFYRKLSDEHKKQLSPFLLNRYASIVKGGQDITEYYLLATNQRVNTQYFELAKHPELVWMLLCTVSPGIGTHFHKWIGHKKKDGKTNNKKINVIKNMYPNAKQDEIDLLSNIISDKLLKELLILHGEEGKI